MPYPYQLMKYNPLTRQLLTDEGHLLKQLRCPRHVAWDDLPADPAGQAHRPCHLCDHTIHDTAGMTDHDLVRLLDREPHACLKIDLDQPNLTLTLHALAVEPKEQG